MMNEGHPDRTPHDATRRKCQGIFCKRRSEGQPFLTRQGGESAVSFPFLKVEDRLMSVHQESALVLDLRLRRWGPSLAVIAMLLNADPCAAYYTPPTFYELVAGSHVVVLGRIVALSDSTYSLAVEEVLVGTAPDTLANVRRFKDWACSQRWLPYAVGQREIAFLRRTASGYRTNSGGAEGEWQVTGDQVTCAYRRIQKIAGPPMVLGLKSVATAMRDFGACVRIHRELPSRYRATTTVESCDSESMGNLAKRSAIHRYLIETLKAAQATD